MRDHGGNLDAAIARFGGAPEDWIDLSTGINRLPYPLPHAPDAALRDLPRAGDVAACAAAARVAYGADVRAACLPLAGAQAAIRIVPALRRAGRAGILGPTYNEHAAAFRATGWQVHEVDDLASLAGFDAVVVVNPNNPDGRRWLPDAILRLARRNGLVVVDESFADVDPAVSICPGLPRPGVLVLRSFGKFHGLAGLRLGFVLGTAADAARLAELAGPWPVSGPALAAGRLALADTGWRAATLARLARDAARLDAIAARAGWTLVGGTGLFRLYETGDAAASQSRLALHRIWSRIFPWSRGWLRLGLPGPESEWTAVIAALL
ncbi:MAG: threonine-phosphate decarboxylase CobD [Amaricoccus sp.]